MSNTPTQEQASEAIRAVNDIMGIPARIVPTARVGIYINIDNETNVADANCNGSATELGDALITAASMNGQILMPIIIAAAALTADNAELRKKFDQFVEYFSSVPQHG